MLLVAILQRLVKEHGRSECDSQMVNGILVSAHNGVALAVWCWHVWGRSWEAGWVRSDWASSDRFSFQSVNKTCIPPVFLTLNFLN